MKNQPQIDLTHSTAVACETCGNQSFASLVIVRKLSAIASPTGEEALVPVPVFGCNACGHINRSWLPMAPTKDSEPEEKKGGKIII